MATQNELLKLIEHTNPTAAKQISTAPNTPNTPNVGTLPNVPNVPNHPNVNNADAPSHEAVIGFDYTRNFPLWLLEHNCSILISTYKAHKLLCLGIDEKTSKVSLIFTNLLRPMGISYDQITNTIYSSNLGNIVQYENSGLDKHEQWGNFDALFVPKRVDYGSDVDIHDLRVSINDNNRKIYYVSASLNSILTVSDHKSFDVFWTPKFISRNPDSKLKIFREDRCHLNGLALVDNKPKYVTAACMRDYYYAWKEHHGEGVVIDIETDEVVCSGLWAPHSPIWYNNRLYIGEAGTGQFGFVDLEKKEFIPKKFLPGFIRGISCHNNFALINISNDRHDTCFAHLPLGHILKEKGQKSLCGICVVNLDTFEIVNHFEFQGLTEIYDITVLPNIIRPRIADIGENNKDIV